MPVDGEEAHVKFGAPGAFAVGPRTQRGLIQNPDLSKDELLGRPGAVPRHGRLADPA